MHKESKIIIITGASSGIGLCTAKLLAENGHTVYGLGRKEFQSDEKNIIFQQCDVTEIESVKNAISNIMNKEGCINVLINNAGAGIVGALDLVTPDEFNFQMKVNFEGIVNMCREVSPIMRKQRQGMIINVSSVGGIMGLPFQGLYSASKFAIEGFSEALRLELFKFNIKIKLIEPGDFNTGFTSHRMKSELTLQDKDYKSQFEKTLKIIENNENTGSDPKKIAKLMLSIIEKNTNKFRYPIGKKIELISIFVKRLVPGRIYQAILRTFYNIK